MNIDATDKLAFALSETEGTYAVFLGSGISKAAGVSTGWDIAMDLVSRMADLLEEGPLEDPESWYQQKFGRPVNYSDIVESLANTPAERNRLVSRYIEPNEEDIREGRKQPTVAHRAIAKLVRLGRIRVIVTTNIDRLMELALMAENVHPKVISSPDDILGMVPLVQSHGQCFVFKVHGDYQDIRSLNTSLELEQYPDSIDQQLDRIFADFGMIVCGWSALWDIALCNAVKRTSPGIYSWFWAEHGVTSDAAAELISCRNAQRIPVEDADSFFARVLRKVELLLGIEPQNPEPVEQGVAMLEGYFHQHLGMASTDFGSTLPALVSQLLALAQPVVSSQLLEGPLRELEEKIDFARGLINSGLVVRARTELDRLKDSSEEIPDDLKFRIITNLAACALAVEDVDAACAWAEEAHALQPDNQTGLANAALAAHLANDSARALDLANQLRELNPRDSQATAVIIGEMWQAGRNDDIDELVASQEWIAEDSRCGLVLANVRILQFRPDDAVSICQSLVAADDSDAAAHLVLAQGLMKRAHSNRASVTFSDDEYEQLGQVVAEATRAIDLLRSTELVLQRHAALVVRACAQALLGADADAMTDLDDVLRERPDMTDAIFYKALLHLTAGRPTEAVSLFEGIIGTSQSSNVVVPLAQSYLSSGDPKAAIGVLAGSFDLGTAEWEDIHRAELLCRAESIAGEESTTASHLEIALQQKPGNVRLLALSAVVSSLSGDFGGAEDALLAALENSDATERPGILARLAFYYQDRDKFSEAADRFREVVGQSGLHPLAVPLLFCLNNSQRLREALEWSQTIQLLNKDVPREVIDIDIGILELVGDGELAIRRHEELCERSDATAVDAVNLAAAQWRVGDVEGATRTIGAIDRAHLLNTPGILLQLAKLKRDLGINDFWGDAYLARRYGVDDAEVHMGYFSLFLGREEEIPRPESVGLGCAVLLRGDVGDRWWYILDIDEDPLGPYDLVPDHDFAVLLLGHKVSDRIVLRHDLEDLDYEVLEILSKYVRPFQETAEEFSTRFPNNMELSRIVVEDDDFSKIFQVVDQSDKFVREFEQLYQRGALPFLTFASLIGRSPLEVWRGCTQGVSRVRFGIGSDVESDMAAALLTECDSIVMDMVALFTAHELGIADRLHDRFSRVLVPQLVLDVLQNLAFSVKMSRPTSSFLGKGGDGRYFMHELPETEWVQWRQFVSSMVEFAESFERVPSYGLLNVDDVGQIQSTFTLAGAGSVWAGGSKLLEGLLLVSDDLVLSNLARAVRGGAVNTQAVLRELDRCGSIDRGEYSRLVERLATMNYWFVQVRAEDILRSLAANGYVTNDGTRAMIRTLEGPESSEDSAVGVAVDLAVELVMIPLPGQFELILERVLAALQRGRDLSPVLHKFQSAIRSDRRLTPSGRSRILSSAAAYDLMRMMTLGRGLYSLR